MKKILFISSMGGHLNELLQLKSMFNKYNYLLVTEKSNSTKDLKKIYNTKFLLYATKRNKIIYPFVLLINSFISLFYFIIFQPDYVISTGAHTAGPMCCIAKFFRKKVIFIETYANIYSQSKTGKIIYKFADLFIVQWPEMLEYYPNAKYFEGGIF